MPIPTTPLLPPSLRPLAEELEARWAHTSRIERTYAAGDVVRLHHRSLDPRQVVRCLDTALLRADRIALGEGGKGGTDWLTALVADAEAGFGGHRAAFASASALIAAGATEIHVEDRLTRGAEPVLTSVSQHVRAVNAARLAADVAGIPATVIARTDALTTTLLHTDADDRDRPSLTGERRRDGLLPARPGPDAAIVRGLACAPYADVLWLGPRADGRIDLRAARRFASAIHERFPGKPLGCPVPPSSGEHRELEAMGYVQLDPPHAADADLLTTQTEQFLTIREYV
jgi:isocitrate lyase